MAFRVGVSHDFVSSDHPTSWGDIGLDRLAAEGIAWEFLPPDNGVLTAEHVAGFDAVVFGTPTVTAATVSGSTPPRLLARFGVGLDAVDVDACTRAGVAVTNTPDGARRAVATAALTLILATFHRLVDKNALARRPAWDGRLDLIGQGLTGRTVGAVGLGNIASELFALMAPFATVNLAHDPYRDPREARARGVELTGLEDLFTRSDVVVVTAALTAQTRHLVNAGLLALMRPRAVLVNVSRGPIVDTAALTEALAAGRLFGAGLDVTDPEPLPVGHPLLVLPNVVLAPHALAWTDEMARGNGASVVQAIIDVRQGRAPRYLADRAVLDHPRLRERVTA
ncbi:NAD(P)-dependent oxidoreductase [Frankia sp. Cr1]|uniref:NAD(P)-dependent oxidoreductase n=1 Tax=Frankia sp. Cr1 TaxID=3073931 RepID=UPI002AD2D8F6|nr:NAD(P)-dependent oxidoreductase [Frankia sp. Cr1]